jgi:DNA transposition AAA+ family ATPase
MSKIIETAPPVETAEIPQANLGNTVRASWNMSADDIRANIANYNADAKEALMKAFFWCIDPSHPVAKPEFAKRVKSSDNTIYKIFTGKYRHPETNEQLQPSAELIKAIREFLTLEKDRFEGGETEFVLTPTARKIVTACDLGRESQSIVFLVGPSHVGKTWALERYYTPGNNHGHTVYCRMRAASGLGGMVKCIAESVGVSSKSNTTDLIERIIRALTPNMLLILDEVHLLAHTYRKGSFHNCMEVIREIHDRAKCGMVLCFTLLDDVKAARQRELQQLWRRGVHKVFLPIMPTKGDVSMILEHHGLEFPEAKMNVTIGEGSRAVTDCPYAILKQVCREEALKAITERLRYARKLANRAGKKLNWSHFVQAHLLIAKQAEQEGEWDL